jgi:hypothetical protein
MTNDEQAQLCAAIRLMGQAHAAAGKAFAKALVDLARAVGAVSLRDLGTLDLDWQTVARRQRRGQRGRGGPMRKRKHFVKARFHR